MDTVFIKDLVLSGKFGLTEMEQSAPQRICIDIEVKCDLALPGLSDKIEDTISYSRIKQKIKEVLNSQPYFCLLERFAHLVADYILFDTRVASVTMTARKLDVWEDGVPGISITRSKTEKS